MRRSLDFAADDDADDDAGVFEEVAADEMVMRSGDLADRGRGLTGDLGASGSGGDSTAPRLTLCCLPPLPEDDDLGVAFAGAAFAASLALCFLASSSLFALSALAFFASSSFFIHSALLPSFFFFQLADPEAATGWADALAPESGACSAGASAG